MDPIPAIKVCPRKEDLECHIEIRGKQMRFKGDLWSLGVGRHTDVHQGT